MASVHQTRPDRALFDSEARELESKLAPLRGKKDKIRYRIHAITTGDPSAERRDRLHAELEQLLLAQGRTKAKRKVLVEQLMQIHDSLPKKERELREARVNMCFMSLAQIDAHISKHQKNLNSGDLKRAGREVALAEIGKGETVKVIHASVKADRAKANELRRLIGAPEGKASRTRYYAIIAELGVIKRDNEFAYKHRRRLYQELDVIQADINALVKVKSAASAKFKDENGNFNKHLREERTKRIKGTAPTQSAQKAMPRDTNAEILREIDDFLN